jgi:hypothetical protein
MRMTAIHCPVLGAAVTCVEDFEGQVMRVLCTEYEQNGTCRLKKAGQQGGPLSQFLQRAQEGGFETRSPACALLMGHDER